jgi:hypothetical protein
MIHLIIKKVREILPYAIEHLLSKNQLQCHKQVPGTLMYIQLCPGITVKPICNTSAILTYHAETFIYQEDYRQLKACFPHYSRT